MFANRYTVFVDACSLVGVLQRNLLLSLAEAGFFRICWSRDVLDETERALERLFSRHGKCEPANLAAEQIARMERAFPEARIEGYYHLQAIQLPDPGDLHVLAAALKAQASTLVTDNLADFPSDVLTPLNIEARSTDEFLADTISLDVGRAVPAIQTMRLRFRRPELTPEQLILRMEAAGLPDTANLLAGQIGSL